MKGCTACRHLHRTETARSPWALQRLIRQVRDEVEREVLVPSDFWPEERVRIDTGPFAELPVEGGWPDVFVYYFRCAACGALFRLSAETYHGTGGSWTPTTPAEEGTV